MGQKLVTLNVDFLVVSTVVLTLTTNDHHGA